MEEMNRRPAFRHAEILESTDDVDEKDSKGRTALFRAARLGQTEPLQLLINRGADVNTVDSTGEAPLQAAARYGHEQCVRLLADSGAALDHCPPPELTEFSESALCSAVRRAPKLVGLLLSLGADPNAASDARRFPLIIAAESEGHLDVIGALLAAGARINEQDAQGRTALHAAIDAGSVPAIKALLDHGADPEIKADHSGTAICTAVLNYEADRAALVLALLAAKPNLSAVCPSWEMTPIELAGEFELPEVEEILILAGSPKPKAEESETLDSLVSKIDTPARSIEVEFCSNSPLRIEPSPQDLELAQDVCKSDPSLCKRYGWRASPVHWRILKALSTVRGELSLSRIAYFARGYLNAPQGEELLDGPRLLGESYESAMGRFVEERLVGRVSDEAAITLGTVSADLKKLAKEHGLKVSSSKGQLVKRLVEQIGLADVLASLSPEPYFVSGEGASTVCAERDKHFDETKDNLRRELLELLAEGELTWGCHLARDLELVYSELQPRVRTTPEEMAVRIAWARETLAAPLPSALEEFAPLENRMRVITAAVSLISDREDDWKIWDPRMKPIYSTGGDLLSPKEFRYQLLKPQSGL